MQKENNKTILDELLSNDNVICTSMINTGIIIDRSILGGPIKGIYDVGSTIFSIIIAMGKEIQKNKDMEKSKDISLIKKYHLHPYHCYAC